MKRRQRRPVLEINQTQSGSHGEHLQNKTKQVSSSYSVQNVPANPLANLLCHYNSDSDTEDSKKDVCKLDDQVNNFLKEIQLIAPKQPILDESSNSALTMSSNTHSVYHMNQQALKWRECIDESSGYPYYWHIETNEVTWEMPEELRCLKNNIKTDSAMKLHTIQESHWVDFSSAAYQQSHENIPEGMIPIEVVARNRNRYICNETVKTQQAQTDQDIANTSDTIDNDSDDGKIEMITSFGSDESDSDLADENNVKNETFPVSLNESVSEEPNQDYNHKTTVEDTKTEIPANPKSSEEKETKYLKNHMKSLQVSKESANKTSNDNRLVKESKTVAKKISNKNNTKSELDFCISLVPGYDEESDAEEELEAKHERKALFPIPQTEDTMESTSSTYGTMQNKHISVETEQGSDSSDSDDNGEKTNVDEQNNKGILEKTECAEKSGIKSEDDVQKSKFLDGFRGQNKFFQRKKRIAFDVSSTKIKTNDDDEANKMQCGVSREEMKSCENTEYNGELQQEEPNTTIKEDKTENVVNPKEELSNAEEKISSPSKVPADTKEDEEKVNLLSQIILEKLKFLSEGKPSISPVQMMLIQLQTLFVAWEGGYLEKSYLRRWLTDTSHDLERLEQDATPPGWLCQWDRSHKRYYYQNTATGITQWTYPDTGIAGGAEEMEICSTPPPTEQEEMVIREEEEGEEEEEEYEEGDEEEEEKEGLKSKPKKLQDDSEATENMTALRNVNVEAPPPPQISNPSPPPPPRIYAEDLKKDKRRKDGGKDKLDKKPRVEEGAVISELNQSENPSAPSHSSASLSPQPSLANVTNVEPLPPGVDLTEAPYELPANALKRIIYSAVQQQGGALYDASARDPTVPILSHPAAIVQEHYLQYPAYHQHLHAPAALVLPHKHSVQPTIQLIPDYTSIYTNHKVIEKPPIKTVKESLVSALDSFYSDIARIESSGAEKPVQRQNVTINEPFSSPIEEAKIEIEQELVPIETTGKEKKRKKTRIGISKKHKEVSSMVAKWQKVQQNFENT